MAFRTILISFVVGILSSCSEYPIYKSSSKGTVIGRNYSLFDSIRVIEHYIVAVQTKSSVKTKVLDTLEVEQDSPIVTLKFFNSVSAKIKYGDQPTAPILKLPYKKTVPKYLNSFKINGNAIVLFPTYRYSVSDEREGGGGIGFAYDNGYQRHNVTQELYVAIYRDSQLVYSNNAVRFEQIRKKKGESIKHEFPNGIADTLLNKALSDYVERLE